MPTVPGPQSSEPREAESASSRSPPSPRRQRALPRGTTAYPRKRAVTACQVCRGRKTKCDNAKPACSFCRKIGARCVQSPLDLSTFDPASLKILERLDHLERLLQAPDRASRPQTTASSHGPRHQGPPGHGTPTTPSLLPQTIESVLEWPHLRLSCNSSPSTANAASASPHSAPSASFAISEPGMQQTRDLVDSFFINVHVKCPMLDEPRIREMVSRLFLHGIDWSAESCLALLICALGAIAAPFGCDDPAPSGTTAYLTATSFYAAAQKRFGPLLGASQLLEAQCLFFAGVFKMSVLERFAAWRLFNQALACCQCFAFLRQSRLRAGDGLSGADSCEVRSAGSQDASTAEQAVYWSAWKSERELRRDLWLPDFHSSETELVDYPSFFPTPPADVDNPDRVLNREHQRRQAASWYFFLSEISLLRLSSLIANDILTFRPLAGESLTQGLANTVLQHEAQVFEWANTLHEDASLQSSPAEDGICKFILRGHLIDLREKIYWVFVDAAINGCSDGANEPPLMNDSILDLAHTGLQNHVERLRVNRPGFRHRHHGTPLMLRTCARSALVLIAAELAVQEAKRRRLEPIIEMPAGWEQAITDVIELCRFWEIDAPELVHMGHKIEKLWDKIREFECPE